MLMLHLIFVPLKYFTLFSLGNLPDSKIEVEINKKQKAFKKFMSPQLSLRYTPDIRFILDETLAYSEKIDNLLKKPDIKFIDPNDPKYL